MSASDIINQVKKFDFNKFNWREACNGPDGKSSAGKFICFIYGIILVIGTLICFTVFIVKQASPILTESSLNNGFLFIGLQMPIVLGYLLKNKDLEIKKDENEKAQ